MNNFSNESGCILSNHIFSMISHFVGVCEKKYLTKSNFSVCVE